MPLLCVRSSSEPNSMKVRSIANKKRGFIEFGSEDERRISGFSRAILPVRIGVIVGVILFFKKFSTPSITPLLFRAC